jgi:hypothetical protein
MDIRAGAAGQNIRLECGAPGGPGQTVGEKRSQEPLPTHAGKVLAFEGNRHQSWNNWSEQRVRV